MRRGVRRAWLALFGLMVVSMTLLKFFGPKEDATRIVLTARFLPPAWMSGGTWAHPLGTDGLGRDEFARLIEGGWISLTTGFSVVVLSALIGSFVGILAGYQRGWLETVLMRCTEAAFAFPGLLLAVVVLSALGPRQLTIIIVLTALGWMGFARISHDLTVEIRQRPFVRAAEGLGMRWPRILVRHVLPGQRQALLTVAVLEFAGVVLAEASLSYLGMGIQPPGSSWGLMVAEGQQYLDTAWWLVTWPGLVIAVTVIVVNQASRALRTNQELGQEREAARSWCARAVPSLTRQAVATSTAATSDDEVLRVARLAVEYGEGAAATRVLDGIDLTLRRGRTLGVVGESGSGKSTLAMALAGLLPSDGHVVAGEVTWARQDRRRIAVVFQDPIRSLNPLMRVGRQVAEGLVVGRGMNRREAQDETARLFEHVGLPKPRETMRRYPFELSGGMCQRVMIAGAIALRPDVLIADEPTSALDVTVQSQILDLLAELQDEVEMATLMITHDFGVVAGSCDEVFVLERGTAVETGSVEQVLLHPQSAYTRGLLACVPKLEVRASRLVTIEEQLREA
ncbi:MAG: dipeptide/oligopeptide/nickel ABC transporter permease/ATP-binding protein [Nocardioides sp.]